MTLSNSDRDPIDRLAEEFADRLRRGERPSLTEYAERYPQLAAEIRELFPVLLTMEQLKPGSAEIAAASPTTTEEPPPHLQRLGDYRILREIGRGGMGVVYEAEQVSLGRHVALKVLPGQAFLTPTQLERFRREAVSAAKLHHTNIVPVYGVGEAEGVHFYAMQFIRGEALDCVLGDLRRLRQDPTVLSTGSAAAGLVTGQFGLPVAGPEHASPLPAPETPRPLSGGATHAEFHRGVANLALQVAEALAYAHRQGVLHRDIKPSNLLLDARGTVWVTDFGLAKSEGADELTHTGDVVGTLRFMAPERFDGRSLPQSDVYALGLTLYELLTLRPAFDDTNKVKLVERILREPPVPPRQIDPRISRDLETVVLKCMAKDPRDRYPSAEELADDLRRFLADRPVRARRTRGTEHLWRWCRRNPAVASLTAVSAALLVAVAVVASVSAVWLEGERAHVTRANADLTAQYEETDAAWHRAEELLKRAERAERATRDRLWEAHLAEARVLRRSRQAGQRFGSLRAVRRALELPVPENRSLNELRTAIIAALCVPDLEVAKEWNGCPLGTTAFALDRNFKRYARADKEGNVAVLRVEDDAPVCTIPGAGASTEYEGLQFSPDGRFLHVLAIRPPRGRLWKIDGPEPILVPEMNDDHWGFAFSPDGRRFAASYPNGKVALFDLETGKVTPPLAGGIAGSKGMVWNPRFGQLALWSKQSWQILDIETGRFDPPTPVPGGISWVTWHTEGHLLAVSNESDFRITYWWAGKRVPARPAMDGPRTAGVVLRSNNAGDRLLSTDWSGLWRLWDARTGQQLLTVPSPGTNLEFSPDDGLVGANVSPPRVQLYRFASGAEFASLTRWVGNKPGKFDHRRRAILHPNGRLLAVSTYDTVALIDLARLEQVQEFPGRFGLPLAFEPTGEALLTYGAAGLCRWPIHTCKKSGAMTFGPATRLTETASAECWGSSADARTIAVPEYSEGATVLRPSVGRSFRVGPQQDVRYCAVSPDGRWVFAGTHTALEGRGGQVWDTHAPGKDPVDLQAKGKCEGWFSPDGKWLVTSSHDYQTWEVGTWKKAPAPGLRGVTAGCAFSGDSKMMALAGDVGVVHLVEPATGRELATLTAPEPSRLVPICFTADNGKLVVLGVETQSLHVFDLKAIRIGLRDFGLDWSAAPLPPDVRKPEPLTVTIEENLRYDRVEAQRLRVLALDLVGKRQYAQALPLFRRAVQADPEFAPTHSGLARLLVTGPLELRNLKEGLSFAEHAVQLEPEDRVCLNTLGVAQYRNDQTQAAVRSLSKSLSKSTGDDDGIDLFFLAMCHAKLGDLSAAKDAFARAVKWVDAQEKLTPPQAEELKELRAEAEAVVNAR